MLHQRTASTLTRDREGQRSSPVASASSTRSNPPSSPSKDKEKIRQWTFPRPSGDSPSSSPSSGAMQSGERSAAGGGGGGPGALQHATQGLSSATSPTGAGTEPAWNNHTLASLAESAPPSPTPQSTPRFSFPDSPPPATRTANAQSHPRAHRPNTSIAYSSATTSSLPLRSRLNPVVLSKILYSNLRRSSLNDLAYGLVFLASLLIFFGALSGQGYHAAQDHVEKDQPQRRVPDKPHGGARVWPVLKQQQQRAGAIEVDIPKAFLPVEEEEEDGEVPADVYQPHGDSSHDRGADFLRDSPEDPDLDDDQTHKVPIRRGREALFGKHTDEHGATHREQEALLAAEHAESLLSNDEEDAEADEDSSDDDPENDDNDTPLLPPEAASHEDSFIAHPLHIIEEDAGELSPPDFFNADPPPPPRAPPVIIMADEPHDDTAAAQELGDSFRRPAGRQGIEETKEQRAAMGREREREHWKENVDAERGDAVEEAIAGVARQRHAREVR